MDLLTTQLILLFGEDWNEYRHGRELARTLNLNQKTTSNKLRDLEEQGIISSTTKGTTKLYTLNKQNTTTTDTLIIAKTQQKILFLSQHPTIKHLLTDTNQIVGIFGSYAKNTANKDSDIDLFVIGKQPQTYEEQGKIFDTPISTKQFTKKEFTDALKEKQPLAAEIAHHHILIHRTEEFIKLLARNYYGYNNMV